MDDTNEQAMTNWKASSATAPVPRELAPNLQDRLRSKEKWKDQPDHRYTHEELRRMSKVSKVEIHRRKRIVMHF